MGGASFKPTLNRLVRIGSQSTTVSEELQAALKLENGFISISALKPGLYRLQQQGAVSTIEVLPAATRKGDLIVTEERILPHSKPASPMITGIKTDEETVTLPAPPSTRASASLASAIWQATGWMAQPFIPSTSVPGHKSPAPRAPLPSSPVAASATKCATSLSAAMRSDFPA